MKELLRGLNDKMEEFYKLGAELNKILNKKRIIINGEEFNPNQEAIIKGIDFNEWIVEITCINTIDNEGNWYDYFDIVDLFKDNLQVIIKE